MRYGTFKLGVIALSATLFGCVKADYTSTTEHPLESQITLKPDFAGSGSGITIPDDVIILQDGKKVIPDADGKLPLVDPGDYRFVIYNEAPPIVVTSQEPAPPATKGDVIAHLPVDGDGFIEKMPDWFFSGFMDTNLEKDKDYKQTLTMQQQIRELNFDLTITQGEPERVTAINAELSGVSSGWNLVADVPDGTAAKVKVPFIQTKEKLNATVRLLGIGNGATHTVVNQILTIHLTFADGRTQQIVSDVSSQLAGFNTNKSVPMTLQGDVHTPIEAGQSGTITGWVVVEEDINVN